MDPAQEVLQQLARMGIGTKKPRLTQVNGHDPDHEVDRASVPPPVVELPHPIPSELVDVVDRAISRLDDLGQAIGSLRELFSELRIHLASLIETTKAPQPPAAEVVAEAAAPEVEPEPSAEEVPTPASLPSGDVEPPAPADPEGDPPLPAEPNAG